MFQTSTYSNWKFLLACLTSYNAPINNYWKLFERSTCKMKYMPHNLGFLLAYLPMFYILLKVQWSMLYFEYVMFVQIHACASWGAHSAKHCQHVLGLLMFPSLSHNSEKCSPNSQYKANKITVSHNYVITNTTNHNTYYTY